MPLIEPFETSFGREEERESIIVRASSGGIQGYGEVVASKFPLYSYESSETAWYVLRELIVPSLLHEDVRDAEGLLERLAFLRGHPMAKGGVEAAFWDLWARGKDIPLTDALGGSEERIEVGVSIGLQESSRRLLGAVERYLGEGYRRIKLKIGPGWDLETVREVRSSFPEAPLSVDANGAYTLKDLGMLEKLDGFHLLMLEQPLSYEDLVDHAELQKQIETPICLDESIPSLAAARAAIELESCKIVNIKPGRVGGLWVARKLHDLCMENSIPVWCGGMLETGVGRAHNIALASLPNFAFPGDISASSRYYARDIVDPPVEVDPEGTIQVPKGPGIGFRVIEKRMKEFCLRQETFR